MQYRGNGFTLIELILVLCIIGLMLGIAVVGVDSLTPGARLNAGARTLASTLAFAHNRAAVLGESVSIRYDLDKRSYSLYLPSSKGSKKTPTKQWKLPKDVYYEDVNVAGYKTQKQGWIEIKMTPTGYVPAHSVHLAHKKGEQVTLEVNPVTGMVKIWEGHQPFRFLVGQKK